MMFIAVRLHTNSITIVSVPDDLEINELREVMFRRFGGINVKSFKTASDQDAAGFRAMGGQIYNIE